MLAVGDEEEEQAPPTTPKNHHRSRTADRQEAVSEIVQSVGSPSMPMSKFLDEKKSKRQPQPQPQPQSPQDTKEEEEEEGELQFTKEIIAPPLLKQASSLSKLIKHESDEFKCTVFFE
jgi:hypothetical protein